MSRSSQPKARHLPRPQLPIPNGLPVRSTDGVTPPHHRCLEHDAPWLHAHLQAHLHLCGCRPRIVAAASERCNELRRQAHARRRTAQARRLEPHSSCRRRSCGRGCAIARRWREIPQRQRGGTGRFTNSADGWSGQPRGVVRPSQMLRSVAEKGGCPAEIRSGRDINACVTRHAGRVSAKSDPPQRAAMGHSWFRRGVGQVACALGISGASTIP
jgi:hypothetical protein